VAASLAAFDMPHVGMIKRFFPLFAAVALIFSACPLSAADIAITAANVVPSSSARFSTQTAGVAITAGQPLYYDTATGTVKLADNNATAPANSLFGIAMSNAAINQPIVVCVYDPALAIGGTVASGATVWLSGNAGGMTSTAADLTSGMTTIVIGVGNGSNKIFFSPITGAAIP
jgi:hypothetical protein